MMLRELAAEGFLNLDVLGRGVDAERFSPARRSRQLRLAWGVLGDDQRVMLYVGRLAREKNVGLALRAFEAASRSDPGLRMIVVGDGPLRRQLQAEFPAAHFVGAQHGENLAGHYASADLFLFPSQSETFGNVTLEALASGLAVVAFNAAAASDYIVHGDNGMVVTPGDEQAFIETVVRCAAMSRESFAALRARARETASQADWGTVLECFEKQLAKTAFNETPEPQHHVVMA
jgi:glycosyltransferase involved in cell wall biosynthesis